MTTFYLKYRQQAIISLILLLLLMIFIILAPKTFLSMRIYIAYMSSIPFAALMAIFMTLVIISGEIDLSFPSIMAAGGFAFAWIFIHTGSAFFALLSAIGIGAIAGCLNGLLVVSVGVPSIIATIGTQFFWRGAIVLISDGLALSLVDFRGTLFHYCLSGRIFGFLPIQTIWLFFITCIVWVILNKYPLGDNICFVGDNKKAAQAMGISVNRTKIIVFSLMGIVSAFTGVLVCSEMANWWPTQGEGYMLIVFASVFIGGTSVFGGRGSIYGTLIGSIIIGIIESGIISAGLSGFWTRMIYGIIVIIAVSVYSVIQK